MLQFEFGSVVLPDYLVGVSDAAVIGTSAAHAVCETRVGIDQGRLDLRDNDEEDTERQETQRQDTRADDSRERPESAVSDVRNSQDFTGR